jgi:hypothetical protein
MTISLNIQSYKRVGSVLTKEVFGKDALIWVHEFEVDDYREVYGDCVRVLPDSLRGNLPKVKNYILDQDKNDVCVLLDDDIKGIKYWENKEAIVEKDLVGFINKYSIMCDDLGFKLWGINLNQDKQVYREYSPFSTISYISSSFSCFLRGNSLRYDERLPLKEDYDMTIQMCNKYRGLLRVNKYFYEKLSAENVGGCATYRNLEIEEEQLRMLQKKWGNHIVKFDGNDRSHSTKKVKKVIDINPVINIPIKGI